MHTYRKHTPWRGKVHTLQWIHTNAQSITYLRTHRSRMVFLSLYLRHQQATWKASLLGLYMYYHSKYTGPASSPGLARHTYTNCPLPPRHYVLWLANWLANKLWLWHHLAGRNWKMGSPLFSPLDWTKDQSCFLHWSNRKRWSKRCPSGWITTIKCSRCCPRKRHSC